MSTLRCRWSALRSVMFGISATALLLAGAATAGVVVPDYPLEGHWPYGPVYTAETYVDVDEQLLFYGEGTVLRIVDVSDPANMTLLGEVRTGNPVWHIDIETSGNLVAVTGRNPTVTLIDVSNRGAPAVLDTYTLEEGRLGYGLKFASEDLLVVAAAPAGLWALDISIPTTISLAGTYLEFGTDFVFDVEVLGDYAFLADDVEGVSAIDISNPASMNLAARFNGAAAASHISLYGNRAYVSRRNSGMTVLDLNVGVSPPTFTEVGVFPPTALPEGFGAINRTEISASGYAVLVDGLIFGNGLVIADISSPASPGSPVIEGFDGRRAFSVALIDDTAFVVYPSELDNIDIRAYDVDVDSNPSAPELIGSRDVYGEVRDLTLNGTDLVIANGGAGVVIVDAANPANPTTSAWIDLPSAASAVVVGNTLVVSETNYDLIVRDITNPASPVALPGYSLFPAYSVNLYPGPGANQVTVAHSQGVRIVDFTNPNAPTTYLDWTPSTYIRRVDIEGNLMATAGGSFVYFVDITDPGSPTQIGQFGEPQTIEDIDIEGALLYVADGVHGMRVYDIANPSLPNEIGSFTPLNGNALGIKSFGNNTYMSSDTLYGMFRLNTGTPSLPVQADLFLTPGSARKIIGNNNYLILSDFDAGVWVWGKPSAQGQIFEDGFESGE